LPPATPKVSPRELRSNLNARYSKCIHSIYSSCTLFQFRLTVEFSGTVDSSVKVDWLLARRVINNHEHDVLDSAVAALDSYTELLAASSRDSQAGSHPEHNFTTALADILHDSGGPPHDGCSGSCGTRSQGRRVLALYWRQCPPMRSSVVYKLMGSICLARLGQTRPGNFILPDSSEVQSWSTEKKAGSPCTS
jgi:hypothetical protein